MTDDRQQITDVHGQLWDVAQVRPTHGFNVFFGWIAGVPRGRGAQFGKAILTADLAKYLQQHQADKIQDIDLPVGKTIIRRLRDEALRLCGGPPEVFTDTSGLPSLLEGPYRPPNVRRGDALRDEKSGKTVIVGGYTAAPIPWPYILKAGGPSLILCGDLVAAVRAEASLTIQAWWGVTEVVVWGWRRALGVEQINPGTKALYQQWAPHKLTPEVAARGRATAMRPESIAKIRASKLGRPAPPNTRAALLNAAKAPKSEAWRAQMSMRHLGRRLSDETITRIRSALARSHEIVPLAIIAEERGVPMWRLARIALRLSDAGLLRIDIVGGELSTSRHALARAEAAEKRKKLARAREYQAEYRQHKARAKAVGDIMRLGADLHKRTKR